MKNKLKGLTLLETVLYLGLFSVIMFIIINFMFSTQEATARTQRKSTLHQASQFINQHLTDTFDNTTSIDPDTSVFLDDQGSMELLVHTENKTYEVNSSVLYYDSIPITPSNVLVDRFYIEPIYDELDIIAVRISFVLLSQKDPSLSETVNLLLTIK